MNFLKECGISDDLFEKILQINGKALENLRPQIDNVNKTINFFKNNNINCIDELLIWELSIFSLDFPKIQQAFMNYGLDKSVELVNEDYSLIEDVIF